MDTKAPRTCGEAKAQGYGDGRTAWQRGYVSRRADPVDAEVCAARGGELNVLLASRESTKYCTRQYLIAP